MRRPRWHDVVLVIGVVAMLAVGVWALWGKDIRAWFDPAEPAPVAAPASGGMT